MMQLQFNNKMSDEPIHFCFVEVQYFQYFLKLMNIAHNSNVRTHYSESNSHNQFQ